MELVSPEGGHVIAPEPVSPLNLLSPLTKRTNPTWDPFHFPPSLNSCFRGKRSKETMRTMVLLNHLCRSPSGSKEGQVAWSPCPHPIVFPRMLGPDIRGSNAPSAIARPPRLISTHSDSIPLERTQRPVTGVLSCPELPRRPPFTSSNHCGEYDCERENLYRRAPRCRDHGAPRGCNGSRRRS